MMPFAAAAFVAIVFPTWERVTPETVTKEVPVLHSYGLPGAVQSADWRKQKPSTDACPIWDHGRVIGFSLGCKDSR